MKFIADVMLGRLARLMRFAGYDVEYDSNADDDFLLKRSRHKMLLTRDRPLAKRASSRLVYFVESMGAIRQLEEIQRKFPLESPAATRCLLCNVKIRKIAKSRVRHLVPPFIFSKHDNFLICPHCGRIYWPGTHFEGMLRVIK